MIDGGRPARPTRPRTAGQRLLMAVVGAAAVYLAAAVVVVGWQAHTLPEHTGPQAAVSRQQALDALTQVSRLASSQRAQDAATACRTLSPDNCFGISGSWRYNPGQAPTSAPTVVCDVALPADPGQGGARLLVVQGSAPTGPYVGQVLVLRQDGRVVLAEPAFWDGIVYTQLSHGRAWNGNGSREAALRPCTDPSGFVHAVTSI